MSWRCYMVTAVEEQEAWLRRYADGPCPAMPGQHRYHDALAHIGRIGLRYGERDESGRRFIESTDPADYAGDERWPTACACGYEFTEADRWQVLGRQLWERMDDDLDVGGERRILDRVGSDPNGVPVWGPGAMFDAWWMGDHAKGPDGLHLSVTLPPDGHPWHIDGPSSSGGRWARSGTPPLVSVTPSILTTRYHGFLGSGVLSDSLSDRPL